MALSSGGRWIFSSSLGPIVLGINNGLAPVFPLPQAGAFNIEVFTGPSEDTTGFFMPTPDPGFQSSMTDPNGTLENNFLTGTALHLGSGDLLAADSVTSATTQGPSQIILGIGNQTVVGAKGDTLCGVNAPTQTTASQIFNALAGDETVIGGYIGMLSIWGGANDSIVAGMFASNAQIVITGTGTTVATISHGSATITAAAQNTITALLSHSNNVIAAGQNDVIDLTGNAGHNAIIGATGDTITSGAGLPDSTTQVEGGAGGMLINVGDNPLFAFPGPMFGTTNVSGSTGLLGNTILGGSGNLGFNPNAVAGRGDLIDLSGSRGAATINAFAFGSTRITSPDTILASSNTDSIFGGDGDRIGTGSGPFDGGTHQWVHADTVPGSAVGFGSNDPTASTIYDTVTGTATRDTVNGASSAQVTVGGFNSATDFLFYQNETSATNSAIVATAQTTSVNGTESTIITLPDGTVITLVGITQVQLTPALFRP